MILSLILAGLMGLTAWGKSSNPEPAVRPSGESAANGEAIVIGESAANAESAVKEESAAQITAGSVQLVTETAVSSKEEPLSLINAEGLTLEERFMTPDGYERIPREMASFQGYLRKQSLKPDGSKVLLYNGQEKGNQSAQAAVFEMPLFDSDLQQCADSVIRMYAEYFWTIGAYDQIAFHLTNGFHMDYPTWREGNRLKVDGNQVSWVKKAGYDDSYETFLLYLQYVMMYAGTLSLEAECEPADLAEVQAGDLFIRGGSPGHCVMVADVAEDEWGERCFLLAQGYMPAQEFHLLKNPLHEEDPWYYTKEVEDILNTPEYTFQPGSLKRWPGFISS